VGGDFVLAGFVFLAQPPDKFTAQRIDLGLRRIRFRPFRQRAEPKLQLVQGETCQVRALVHGL
jgi:hypothetical protein